MQDFRNIDAWCKAHELVLRIYRESKAFPKEEIFGITHQLRRGSTNVATRIAEGSGKSNPEFAIDLKKAAAHCSEVEYSILLAHDLGIWNDAMRDALTDSVIEVRKMIFGLLRKL